MRYVELLRLALLHDALCWIRRTRHKFCIFETINAFSLRKYIFRSEKCILSNCVKRLQRGLRPAWRRSTTPCAASSLDPGYFQEHTFWCHQRWWLASSTITYNHVSFRLILDSTITYLLNTSRYKLYSRCWGSIVIDLCILWAEMGVLYI